jgi:predicted nucleotidyltransferase
LRGIAETPGVTVKIDLLPEHRALVSGILAEHLPLSVQVWVFGSRATGRARRYSDLDLAIDAGRPLTLDETALLREAFEDSDLPYRVDIVDWQTIGERFRRLIAAERVPLLE